MIPKYSIGAVALLLFLACATPTDSCGCSPREYQVHFVGFVMQGVDPATGAQVTAAVFDTDCQSKATAVSYLAVNGSAVDASGRYRFEVSTWRADTLCARVVARLEADSAVRKDVPVPIPSTDTVRVDLQLPS